MSENVTLGEVFRLCQRIETKVDATNGRVRKLENDAIRIKTLWTAGVILVGLAVDAIRNKLGL